MTWRMGEMSRRTRLAYQILYGPNPPISLQSNQRITVPPLSIHLSLVLSVHCMPMSILTGQRSTFLLDNRDLDSDAFIRSDLQEPHIRRIPIHVIREGAGKTGSLWTLGIEPSTFQLGIIHPSPYCFPLLSPLCT